MKTFHCDHCSQIVFFENVQCLRCDHALSYLPDLQDLCSLESADNGLWRTPARRGTSHRYRLCENYTRENICNWAIPADDPNPLCRSCRLTRVIPNLGEPANKAAWHKLEVAKRRLLYGLLTLGLPLRDKLEEPDSGLAFEFLADRTGPSEAPVLTGHAGGVITLNIAEADDAVREKRRTELHEPYRTLLGHFRHEIGHYYWDRLIQPSQRLSEFRQLFGDERADYAQALKNHYDHGAEDTWQERFISAYASVHPWEDWAESWAHYLHMRDALETAAAGGLSLRPSRQDEPALKMDPSLVQRGAFDPLIDSWYALTYMLNNFNRGLGLADAYPFVLSAPVIEKLRFIHETIPSNTTA